MQLVFHSALLSLLLDQQDHTRICRALIAMLCLLRAWQSTLLVLDVDIVACLTKISFAHRLETERTLNSTVELLANVSLRSAAQHFGQQPSTVSICREPHAPQHRPWSLPAWSESTLCEGHYLPSRTYSTLRARNQDHC